MKDEARLRAARLLAVSPSAMPMADALAHIRARREQLLAEPEAAAKVAEPDLAPAPLPDIIDDPFVFGADLAKRRAVVLPDPPKPKKRAGRQPKHIDAKPELDRFRVIDGGGDKTKPG